MHFCAPPRALRSFRPIWIRAPCDLELEITRVHHRPDGCLGDLDRVFLELQHSRRDYIRLQSELEVKCLWQYVFSQYTYVWNIIHWAVFLYKEYFILKSKIICFRYYMQ